MADELNQKIPGPEKEIEPKAIETPAGLPEKEKPFSPETEPASLETRAEEALPRSDLAPGGKLAKMAGKPGEAVVKTPAKISPDEKTEIDAAVQLAFDKGIDEAVQQIRKTQNAHLIDAFHDFLVDELYQRLVQSGKLNKD